MKKLLIVDDASVVRLMIRKVLKESDYTVVGEAKNGKEALEKYKDLNPDVVTMDLVMPVVDGIQATSDIVSFDKDAKVIIVSGIDQREMLMRAIEAGASSYIVKPFEADRVIATLNEVLAN